MVRKPMLVLIAVLTAAFSLMSVSAQGTLDPTQPMPFYLLTIRGSLAPATVADAEALHNKTAGDPASVAAAKSLGDLSHMIYLSMQNAASGAGEVLFLDQWNSVEGLNTFFANPTVQEQGGQIFTQRDAAVWAPAEGYYNYHLATPYGNDTRIVALVRGTVASRQDAMTLHNQIVASQINTARAVGDIAHDAYFMVTPPGTPDSLEFLAVDVWTSAEGMMKYYGDPGFQAAAAKLFTAPPAVSTWNQTTGGWVEW